MQQPQARPLILVSMLLSLLARARLPCRVAKPHAHVVTIEATDAAPVVYVHFTFLRRSLQYMPRPGEVPYHSWPQMSVTRMYQNSLESQDRLRL